MAGDSFAKALELWIHGGAVVDPDGIGAPRRHVEAVVHRAAPPPSTPSWRKVIRFTNGHLCRMLQLVRYFGDQEDSGEPCGPATILRAPGLLPGASASRARREHETMERILRALADEGDMATGRLLRRVFEPGGSTGDRSSTSSAGSARARPRAGAGRLVRRRTGSGSSSSRSLTDTGLDRGADALDAVPIEEAEAPKKKKPKGSGKQDAARRAFFAEKGRKRKKGDSVPGWSCAP